MCYTSKFTSHVTMVPNFFFIIVNKVFTNLKTVTLLKYMFFFFTHDQISIKVFVHYFSAVLILLKHCFNKFISSIFASNNSWLSKPIINTNNFVSETARRVILIFFRVRTFIAFGFL